MENSKDKINKIIIQKIMVHAIELYKLIHDGATIDITFEVENEIVVYGKQPKKTGRLIVFKPNKHLTIHQKIRAGGI